MADDLEMENLEEEDEEPLFADDIGDDDDLPPLPPPMPSLSSQLNSSRQHPTSTVSHTAYIAECVDVMYTVSRHKCHWGWGWGYS